MPPFSGRTAAVVGALATALAPTAACSLHRDACTDFALDFAVGAHGQSTPEAAVEAFSRQGTARVPASGSRRQSRDDGGVGMRSGTASLHVTRLPDGSWAVDSGTTC